MEDTKDWVKNWSDVGDAALSAILFYVLIVALVRLLGNRSTAQLNNFDWIINVTVGSLAASGILLDSVPALRAAAAILTIMVLQFLSTYLVMRFDWMARIIKTSPTLLTHNGEFLQDSMRKTRVSEEEICSVLRQHGIARREDMSWVVLETDGTLTVIPKNQLDLDDADTMCDVDRPDNLS